MSLCHFQSHLHAKNILCLDTALNSIDFSTFWQDVCEQANQIVQLQAEEWALWEQDSYQFLVLFFAGLLANKRMVLAPNRIKDLELALLAQGIEFLSRQPINSVVETFHIDRLNLDDAFLNQAQVYFYTSGSTGQPKKIPRTLRQLLNEVQGLHASFTLPSDSIAIATVSHQHIYGLLFKLLLPLASGRSFYVMQLAFPEDVVQVQKKLQSMQQRSFVIASPAVLKRWTSEVELVDCDAVYSSGGKLDAGVRAYINAEVTEILGSSETGGMGYRHADDALWTPFANVEVRMSEQQELAVKTNHAFQNDWIFTGDRAALVESNNPKSAFRLLGRVDRIIKLEEKRLSLDAIEQQILTLAEVAQCHALLIEHEQRQILACVVVLEPSAQLQLQQTSKRHVVQQLKAQLSDKLEAIAIPRQWRFLSQLPQNSQSKLNKKDMKALFAPMLYPVVLSSYEQQDQQIFQLEFPAELQCFKGHFPNYPIYPGVGQIGFVQHFAKQLWADLDWCSGYEQLKFQDLIRPYSVLQLKLNRKLDKVYFELCLDDKNLASGRLLFEVKVQALQHSVVMVEVQ